MSWDIVSVVSDVVSAIAVVVSLIYLGIQVRSNTRATKASASFDATHSWATFNESALENPELLSATLKAFDPEVGAEDLSAEERQLVSIAARALFQKLEGQYYLYKHGYMEPQLWKCRLDWARGLVVLPVFSTWWRSELDQKVFSPEFSQAIRSEGDPVAVRMAGFGPETREGPDDSAS